VENLLLGCSRQVELAFLIALYLFCFQLAIALHLICGLYALSAQQGGEQQLTEESHFENVPTEIISPISYANT